MKCLKLSETPCKSCPFYNSELRLSNERLAEIYEYLAKGVNHVCHSTNKHVCFGGRQIQLRMFYALGFIKEPTNEALFEAMRAKEIEPKIKL